MTAQKPMTTHLRLSCLLAASLVAIAPSLLATVARIEINSREPYAQGRAFDEIGPYERCRGQAFFAVDPKHPANQTVIDLGLAPRNPAGLVEFSADVEWLAPKDLAKANGAVLYDVNNRGNKVAPGMFNTGADEFLMRKGYVVLWSGWIAQTQPGEGRLRLRAPPALQDGKPLVGLVRAEVVPETAADRHTLAQWANQGSFEPTERGERDAVLTWRLREKDARITIPREQWRFEKRWIEVNGERGEMPQIDLVLPAGLQPGYIYEVVYEAQGSLVQGLGLAGIRDLVAFLKYDASDQNPFVSAGAKSSAMKFAYGFGVSQSGRCLRQFLYDGFNADEQARQVFDAVMPHVAGGGLGFFNHRFASPTRHNSQHDNHLFPADQFPFTYGDERDPFSGREDGILRRDRARGTVPKVMHTQSSSEYWHRAGSLVHTDPTGVRDSVLPREVRVYCFGGTQHGAGSGKPGSAPDRGQLIGNPADYRPLLRALLTALDQWVRTGQEPPASVYPRISDGTLAGWREKESGWSALPGVRYPEVIHTPEFLDRGSEFFPRRRSTIEPPISRGLYGVKVLACGADNNERGALLIPAVAVPAGTYTSWNLRSRAHGAENELVSLAGGYVPFAKTAAERERLGDPRPSLRERYRSFDDYSRQFRAAAEALISKRCLLAEELESQMKSIEWVRPNFD